MPAAVTRIRARSPAGSGSGRSTSRRTSGPPNSLTWIARIRGTLVRRATRLPTGLAPGGCAGDGVVQRQAEVGRAAHAAAAAAQRLRRLRVRGEGVRHPVQLPDDPSLQGVAPGVALVPALRRLDADGRGVEVEPPDRL